MKADTTRRTILRGGLALAGLGILGIPEWALPLLAEGDTLVPFTDIPENVRWETPPDRRTHSAVYGTREASIGSPRSWLKTYRRR